MWCQTFLTLENRFIQIELNFLFKIINHINYYPEILKKNNFKIN